MIFKNIGINFTQETKVERYVPMSALKLNVKKHITLT